MFLLQRRLDEIKKRKRNITILSLVIVALLGVVSQLYGLDFVTGMFLAIGIGFFVGVPLNGYYGKQESAILWEIQRMATYNPKCFNCGKEIPQGNFKLCPFCGKSLKTGYHYSEVFQSFQNCSLMKI